MDRSYVAENDTSRARLAAFVARLSDDDLLRALPDGWTVAATLAHIAFWDRRTAVLIARWTRDGVSPSPYDFDAINDAMLPAWRLLPPRAAAEEALAAADMADRAVASAPDNIATAIEAQGSTRLDRARHRNHHLNELEPLFA